MVEVYDVVSCHVDFEVAQVFLVFQKHFQELGPLDIFPSRGWLVIPQEEHASKALSLHAPKELAFSHEDLKHLIW